MKKKSTKYDDIIQNPHHVSSAHPQMPIEDRAAQFSPFAALTGHDEAVKETARLTECKVELDEHCIRVLNEKLRWIGGQIEKHPMIEITYFQPDVRKEGGSYMHAKGTVRNIDAYRRCIVMEDGLIIPMEEIYDIGGEVFKEIF